MGRSIRQKRWDQAESLVRRLLGGGGMRWVGPPLRQFFYATFDANKCKSRGWRCRHHPPRVGRFAAKGACRSRPEVGGEWQAPPWTLWQALARVAAAQAGERARGARKDAAPAAAWRSRGIRGSPGAPLPPTAEQPPGRLQRH